MLRVDSVEGLFGVCAPFVCPFFLPVVWADSTTIVAVLSHFLYILMHILPLHTRANASLLTSVVGEYACSMRCVRAPLLIERILRYAIGVLPDIYVLTCVDALLVRVLVPRME